eukprot:59554_1
MSDTVITASLILTIVLMLLSAIMFLWVYNFYRLLELPEIDSRKPKSSLLAGILCTGANMLVLPGCLLYLNNKNAPHIPWIGGLINLGLMLTIIAPYHILTFRAYIVYFDIKFNEVLEDRQWRLSIDPEETNWYLKHRHSWGSPKRIAIALFSHWSLFTLLVIGTLISYGAGNTISRAFIGASALIPMCIDIYLYLRFPTFDDTWGIHNEIKLTLRAELFQVIGYYALLFGLKPQYQTMDYFYSMLFVGFTTFSFVIVIQFWVFRVFRLPSLPCYVSEYLKQKRNCDGYNESTNGELSTTNGENKRITIKDALQDIHGFNLFARHLSREFCIESLLFFVETQQWKTSLYAKPEYMSFEQTRFMQIVIPQNAPQSRIMEMEDGAQTDADALMPTTREYIQTIQLTELYKHFGYYDSSPTADEKEYLRIVKEETKMDRKALFHLFDEPRKEVYSLLRHGFLRFKATDGYQKWYQHMANDYSV